MAASRRQKKSGEERLRLSHVRLESLRMGMCPKELGPKPQLLQGEKKHQKSGAMKSQVVFRDAKGPPGHGTRSPASRQGTGTSCSTRKGEGEP